jgi:hypothetical protein
MFMTRYSLTQCLGFVKDALGVFQDHLSGFRQSEASFRANKQRLTQIRFQGFDLVTHCRLSQV